MAPGDKKGRRARSLKIKCPTWDHVEAFYSRKLRKGNVLPIRVPFMLGKGASLTIALELPNEMVMAIDGEVTAAAPAADGKKSAIQLTLHGMTPEVLGRLESLVSDAKKGHGIAEPAAAASEEAASAETAATEPPPAQPTDAPVDELVAPPPAPQPEDVAEDERSVFTALDKELRQLRESAAHEVLGVGWDATVEEIRRAYFRRTKRYHPDIFSRYQSDAIRHLAQEVFIHVNRAYDRMRDAAVADGAAFVAGPALLPHDGWLASFEDLGEEPQTPLPGRLQDRPAAPERRSPPPPPSPAEEPASEAEFELPPALEMDADLPPAIEMDADLPPGVDDDEAPAPAPAAPPMSRASSEPAVSFTTDQGSAENGLSPDKLFGDLDLGSNPAMKLPADGEPEPELSAEELEASCRKLLAEQDFEAARTSLAEALRKDPRNRRMRALYHVASGRVLQSNDESVQATAQFEAALAHDRDCEEAKEAIADMHKAGSRKGGLFRRIFK